MSISKPKFGNLKGTRTLHDPDPVVLKLAK